MKRVKLEDIDMLYELSTEMCVLTYLQYLVKDDDPSLLIFEDFESIGEATRSHLLDLQIELAMRIRKLIISENFYSDL